MSREREDRDVAEAWESLWQAITDHQAAKAQERRSRLGAGWGIDESVQAQEEALGEARRSLKAFVLAVINERLAP